MKIRALLFVSLTSALVALSGCKGLLKKKGDANADAAVAAASASAAAAAAAAAAAVAAATPSYAAPAAPPPVALDEASVPTPQDFEDEAAEKVTPANFKAELAKLQKEIGQ
ncbi:MAG TPA: hypothetical protein VHB79_33060 [Polyangiaceae bacterium]|nr:hypothetical protein [Polyangiaceae bacterium]